MPVAACAYGAHICQRSPRALSGTAPHPPPLPFWWLDGLHTARFRYRLIWFAIPRATHLRTHYTAVHYAHATTRLRTLPHLHLPTHFTPQPHALRSTWNAFTVPLCVRRLLRFTYHRFATNTARYRFVDIRLTTTTPLPHVVPFASPARRSTVLAGSRFRLPFMGSLFLRYGLLAFLPYPTAPHTHLIGSVLPHAATHTLPTPRTRTRYPTHHAVVRLRPPCLRAHTRAHGYTPHTHTPPHTPRGSRAVGYAAPAQCPVVALPLPRCSRVLRFVPTHPHLPTLFYPITFIRTPTHLFDYLPWTYTFTFRTLLHLVVVRANTFTLLL